MKRSILFVLLMLYCFALNAQMQEAKFRVTMDISDIKNPKEEDNIEETVLGKLKECYNIGYFYEYKFDAENNQRMCFVDGEDDCDVCYRESIPWHTTNNNNVIVENLYAVIDIEKGEEIELSEDFSVYLEKKQACEYSLTQPSRYFYFNKNTSWNFSKVGTYELKNTQEFIGEDSFEYQTDMSLYNNDYSITWKPIKKIEVSVCPLNLDMYYVEGDKYVRVDSDSLRDETLETYIPKEYAYSDTIKISATKGFTKDVYPWKIKWIRPYPLQTMTLPFLEAAVFPYMSVSESFDIQEYSSSDGSEITISVKELAQRYLPEGCSYEDIVKNNYYCIFYTDGYNKYYSKPVFRQYVCASFLYDSPQSTSLTGTGEDGNTSGVCIVKKDLQINSSTISTENATSVYDLLKVSKSECEVKCSYDEPKVLIVLEALPKNQFCRFSIKEKTVYDEFVVDLDAERYDFPEATIYEIKDLSKDFEGIVYMESYVGEDGRYGYCKSRAFEIKLPTINPLTMSQPTYSLLKCYGDSTSVYLEVNGGEKNGKSREKITSIWQNELLLKSQLSEGGTVSFSGIKAGEYYITLSTTDGCKYLDEEGNIQKLNLEITQPDELKLELRADSVKIYGENSGKILYDARGGTPDLYLVWDVDTIIPQVHVNNHNSAIVLPKKELSGFYAGTYTFYLSDKNNCKSESQTISIYQPEKLEAEIVIKDTIKCNGDETAKLSVENVKGGVGGYQFLWSNDQTQSSIENLAAGEYGVTITDKNGAKVELLATISQPDILSFTIKKKDEKCLNDADGEIEIVPQGGTIPYTYFYNKEGEEKIVCASVIENLSTGKYYVLLEDINGCKSELTKPVEITTQSNLNFSVYPQDPTCYNGNNGSIIVDTNGENYRIRWSEEDFSPFNLKAGTYGLTVTDKYGCTEQRSVTLYNPTKFSFGIDSVYTICIGNKDRKITVGDYKLAGIEWYKNNELQSQNVSDFYIKEAGNYKVKVTLYNWCEEEYEFKVQKSEESIGTSFTVADVVPMNDDVRMVNLSPDNTFDTWLWKYENDDVWVYDEGEYYIDLTFLKPGKHTVGVVATKMTDKGECLSEHYKEIVVDENMQPMSYEGGLLEAEMIVIPNDNGTYIVDVRFTEKNTVLKSGVKADFYLFSVEDAKMLSTQTTYTFTERENKFQGTQILPRGKYILIMQIEEYKILKNCVFLMQ